MPLDKLQTFKIDPRDAKKLERIATARGTSIGAVIRDAIHDAIYGPAWALELLEEIRKNVESEYASREAILETAKEQVEEKIKTLTKDAENLTEKMAELLQKEAATDELKEALEIRKQYAEMRDLFDITSERLKAAKEKHAEILRSIAQLEKEKNQKLNDALRQAFPRVCEPLLEALANRLADVAHALDPFLHAYTAAGGAREEVLERFLWHRLGELVRERNADAVNLLGRPTPLFRSNYQSWNAFWQHWETQTGCQIHIEDTPKGEAEEEAPEARVSVEN
jgi:Skp family chaperone for outer membrane proteins